MVLLGLAVPMIIAGIAGWTSEAMGKGEGLSYGAMGWFILAEAMIFVSFFVGYWYTRLHTEVWPPAGTILAASPRPADSRLTEPVVVVVGEAAGDPAGEFDEPVHGLGAAVG